MDINWVKTQFTEAKVKVAVGKTVIKLLEFWEKEVDLTKEDAKEALRILEKLAFNNALVPEKKDELWVRAQRGQISVGDKVRVAYDAYDSSVGRIHNGREGVIIAIRSGDVIFKSTDEKEPELDGVHYNPDKLEKG